MKTVEIIIAKIITKTLVIKTAPIIQKLIALETIIVMNEAIIRAQENFRIEGLIINKIETIVSF